MATLDWHVTTEGGVTLVHLLVTSDATERVRVTNCLDGPVWPPRRQGVPEDGWDEDGFEGVVAPDERLVLGYACPADPCEPPARVTALGPGEDDPGPVTAREVIRTLGDPSPPRDAVSGSEPVSGTPGEGPGSGSGPEPERDGFESETDPGTGDNSSGGGTVPGTGVDGSGEVGTTKTDESGQTGTLEEWQWGAPNGGETPDAAGDGADRSASHRERQAAVDAWLADVEGRIEDAERLARVSSVQEATEAVAPIGGPEDIARLRDQLAADSERLERVATRCESLSSRLADVEVPVEALQRLA